MTITLSFQSPLEIEKAYTRIKDHVLETPVIHSTILNKLLGHEIYFKVDALQYTGAFKVRGVLNHLLAIAEDQALPTKCVSYSTGNHGLGMAWAAQKFKIKARVYLPNNVTRAKQILALLHQAEIINTISRLEAEQQAFLDQQAGFYYLHPSDSDTTIAGVGTMCYEALKKIKKIDAIFAGCGGGGLLSGTYLAKELLSPETLVFGGEPATANDAFLSLQQNKIFRFTTSPTTIADSLRTLGVSLRTFMYLQKLNGMFLAEEEQIKYWIFWLNYLLNITCEPAGAVAMEAAYQWLGKQATPQKILVLISGGNIDPQVYLDLDTEQYLSAPPSFPKINS